MTKTRRGEDPHKPPRCIGTPPPTIADPIVRRRPVGRFVWEDAILGKTIKGRRKEPEDGHVPPHYVGVALALATAATGKSGANARPGVAGLARQLGLGERIVKKALAWLEEYGFIVVQTDDEGRDLRGGRDKMRRRYATVYRLSLPAPLAAALGLWEGGEPWWMERPETWPTRRELHSPTVEQDGTEGGNGVTNDQPTGCTNDPDQVHKMARPGAQKPRPGAHTCTASSSETSSSETSFRAYRTTSLAVASDGAVTKSEIKTLDRDELDRDELDCVLAEVENDLERPIADQYELNCAEDMARRGCAPKFIARTIRKRAES